MTGACLQESSRVVSVAHEWETSWLEMAEESSCGSGSPYNGQIGLRVGGIFIILVSAAWAWKRDADCERSGRLRTPGRVGGRNRQLTRTTYGLQCTSAAGTLFPQQRKGRRTLTRPLTVPQQIISRRSRLRLPEWAFNGMKWFGSGIIVATAFIHLLAPAFDALSSDCLSGAWKEYDWAPAIAMAAVFGIFLVELIATRAGASFLKKRGLRHHDPHHARGNDVAHTGHGSHPPALKTTTALACESIATVRSSGQTALGADLEASVSAKDQETAVDGDHAHDHGHAHGHAEDEEDDYLQDSAVAQCIGVAILEFGVIFHSFVIGLTLAVTDNIGPLLAVLTFHQTFEGIGLGSRLSMLRLPRRYNFVPFVAGVIYSCTTPLGIAVGLGIRETYNPDSTAASIVSGVLDATSAGILLWAGLVECLAHDFVFDRQMADASNGQVTYAVTSVFVGAGLMALLGRWA
ncbi:hypothetical protein BMF94_6531 [Rhodotorula taiwanensis]|uniref:Uncharacterized protein n=1 Tax=Rhodotorula taiwanensis TaxID=741276 RepID=A0A2S5B110_9BASI|nr:hypothetical protein BMF94_6531 [Rhodotorula taiwanensis]